MHQGFKKLDQFLSKYDNFIISTHESPDWDGLGAEIAFRELLVNLGKNPIILNSDPVFETYENMDIDNEINVLTDDKMLPENICDYAQIVLDTNEFTNIGAAYTKLSGCVRDIFIIDHHEGGKDKLESNFIKVEASSACEIVYEIIKFYKKPISFKAAQALFAGTVFDTGSFQYSKTSKGTFKMASELVSLGVKPHKVYEKIYENNSLPSFELRALIISSMEVLYGGKLVAMKLTPDMLIKSGASFPEGETTINLPLTVRGVVASVLVKQDVDSEVVKVSMRTKDDLNVAEIAMANGGGGHKNAAGYKSKVSLEETYKQAIINMKRLF